MTIGRFSGKVAVVIGGATGIGASTAKRLANEGAKVLIGDINMADAAIVAEAIRAKSGIVDISHADLANDASMSAVMDQAVNSFGSIDCLFLNGADVRPETMAADSDIVAMDLALWDRIIGVNLRGYMLGLRFGIPIMLKSGGGSIVCTSTEYSITSHGSLAAYGVSKSGVNQLVRHVAARWGREGIRCNGVLPGCIQTETMRKLITPELEARFLQAICGLRLGLPEDVAGEVVHLLSDDALFMNGQTISVNGGSVFR
jgi:NAD(P)-dependent dehydrogenase (short-subunit alcohol dehydrogenase family)